MKRVVMLLRKASRARRISDIAKAKFNSVLYSCACVSKVNNSLSYIIRRSGAFGEPVIEPIPRPDVVRLSEADNYVVVKDGKIFELTTNV